MALQDSFRSYFIVNACMFCRHYGHLCPNCERGKIRSKCCSAMYTIPLCRNDSGQHAKVPLRIDTRAHVWRKLHKKRPAISPIKGIPKKINPPTPIALEVADLAPGQLSSRHISTTPEISEVRDPSLIQAYDECPRCPTCVSLPCVTILLKVVSHPMLLQVRVELSTYHIAMNNC
jgi:hypothetical protein